MIRAACLIYGSVKAMCSDILDGIYILEVNSKPKERVKAFELFLKNCMTVSFLPFMPRNKYFHN